MSDHYHDPADIKRLKDMRALAPADYEAWVNFNRIIARTDGSIPRKYRELIAVGVAVAIQCPFCMEAHAKGAKAAGATREGDRRGDVRRIGDSSRGRNHTWDDGAGVLRPDRRRPSESVAAMSPTPRQGASSLRARLRRTRVFGYAAGEEAGHRHRPSRLAHAGAGQLQDAGCAAPRWRDVRVEAVAYPTRRRPRVHEQASRAREDTARRPTALKPDAAIWVSWPKKTSKVPDRHYGRRDPRCRAADGIRRHQSVRRRRHVVGIEAGCAKRASMMSAGSKEQDPAYGCGSSFNSTPGFSSVSRYTNPSGPCFTSRMR